MIRLLSLILLASAVQWIIRSISAVRSSSLSIRSYTVVLSAIISLLLILTAGVILLGGRWHRGGGGGGEMEGILCALILEGLLRILFKRHHSDSSSAPTQPLITAQLQTFVLIWSVFHLHTIIGGKEGLAAAQLMYSQLQTVI